MDKMTNGTDPEVCYYQDGDKNSPVKHDYVEAKRKESTCRELGYVLYRCVRCGHVFKKELEKIPHVPVDKEIHKRRLTCMQPFRYYQVCINCGGEIPVENKEAEIAQHKFERIPSECREATCAEPGIIYERCMYCGEIKTTQIPALNHDWGETFKKPDACEKPYLYLRKCKNCGIEEPDPSVPEESKEIRRHNFQKVDRESVKATCEQDGQDVLECLICHRRPAPRIIPKLSHNLVGEIKQEYNGCEKPYLMLKKCSMCGKWYPAPGAEEIIAHHNYVRSSELSVAPTCTSTGSIVYVCEFCGDRAEAEQLPKLPHDFTEEYEQYNGCGQEITIVRKCKSCGLVETISGTGRLANHDYVKDEASVVKATCAAEGSYKVKCSKCGDEKTYKIARLAHRFGPRYEQYNGCEEKNTYLHKCELCGTIEAIGFSDKPTEHNYVPVENEKVEPTCSTEGYYMAKCSLCGEKKRIDLPKLEHTFEGKGEKKYDGCGKPFILVRTCKVCGAKDESGRSEELAEHILETVPEKCARANCIQEGLKVEKCVREGCDFVKETPIAKTGHRFDDETFIRIQPTCTSTGTKSHNCVVCGETVDLEGRIPKTRHEYVENDELRRICKYCGKEGRRSPEFFVMVATVIAGVMIGILFGL